MIKMVSKLGSGDGVKRGGGGDEFFGCESSISRKAKKGAAGMAFCIYVLNWLFN